MGDGNPEGVRLVNPPEYDISRLQVEGRPVLAIPVQENEAGTKPCFVKAKGMTTSSDKRIDDKVGPVEGPAVALSG